MMKCTVFQSLGITVLSHKDASVAINFEKNYGTSHNANIPLFEDYIFWDATLYMLPLYFFYVYLATFSVSRLHSIEQ